MQAHTYMRAHTHTHTHIRTHARTPGVNPQRYLDGFTWDEFKWRRGELEAQFKGLTVLAGVDDMDSFKGIDLKLQVGGLVRDEG